MNMKVSEEFGQYFSRLPLTKSATIVQANALQRDWREIVPPRELSYILGNPPFGGSQISERRATSGYGARLSPTYKARGCWILSPPGIARPRTIWRIIRPSRPPLFPPIPSPRANRSASCGLIYFERGVKIHFAHRTFQWSSEARGKAAVHCVIIGFALQDSRTKLIFDYEKPKTRTPCDTSAKNINPYLV